LGFLVCLADISSTERMSSPASKSLGGAPRRQLDKVAVKGKDASLTIWQVMAMQSEASVPLSIISNTNLEIEWNHS
jgi:hypothetical protein